MQVQAGGYVPGVALSTNVYVDCIVVSDAYIGPETSTTLKSVSDSLGVSDAVLRHKTILPVADIAGLSDSILQDKAFVVFDSTGVMDSAKSMKNPLLVSDAVGLADFVDVIAGAILKYVIDTADLTDSVLLNKTVIANDVATLVDQVLRDKSAMTVADEVGVAEVVEVGVAGSRKTKLFLVLGGLALQLTGET